jgi:hypothetical protein
MYDEESETGVDYEELTGKFPEYRDRDHPQLGIVFARSVLA